MEVNEKHEKLLREFDSTRGEIRKCLGMKEGGQKAENNYGIAYQKLVGAGLAPQLKQKYRRGI